MSLDKNTLSNPCKQLLRADTARDLFGCDFLECPDDDMVVDTLLSGLGYDRDGNPRGTVIMELV
jgi:hypothetical protein